MKKKSVIISILVIVGLTSLRLYKKYQKAEIEAQKQEELRKQGELIIQQQKEAKMAEYKAEEKRINDSIAKAQSNKLSEGLQMLKEAKENLKNAE